ncbi:MAG: UbiD family decarboxylase [Burkholderiales bacterium]|nr:UbiD family decarboxylase [Burkholderiales bacterium]
MIDQSIRGHLRALEAAGELIRIRREVDPDENLSALSFQALAGLGKACLFESIRAAPQWQVASQIVADRRKWGVALGVAEQDVVARFTERVRATVAPVLVDRTDAPVKEVIQTGDGVDLRQIPAMWTSEQDPARYIASGMCIIKDPDTGIRNVSVHRAQVYDRASTGYYMLPRQAMRIQRMYGDRGKAMPAAMVIGGHPLIMFASGFVAPFGVDELAIAGSLLGEPVRLVRCEAVDIEVPAEAEIVLEGEIAPGDIAAEGPFGEVTGTYSKRGDSPVFRVKALSRRRNPIFYAMTCGQPPSDAHSITCATVEVRLAEHLRNVDGGMLDIRDIRCIGAMSPLMVALRIEQRYPGQARTALMAAASSPYLHPKFLVAVDGDIDISEPGELLWALGMRLDPAAGLTKIDRTRVFSLDNASPLDPGKAWSQRVGTKMLIDATRPFGLPPSQHDSLARTFPPGFEGVRLTDLVGSE